MSLKDSLVRALFRREKALAPPKEPQRNLVEALAVPTAASGTDNSYGNISGYEKNPQFSSPGAWAETADEMLRTFSRLRALDRVLRHSMKSVDWRAEAASEKPEAIRNAKFVNEMYGWDGVAGRMREPFEETMDRFSHFARVGFRTAEERAKAEYWEETGEFQIWLDQYFDMEPSSIQRWIQDPATGELASVQQFRTGGFSEPAPRPTPAENLLVLTLDQTGKNYEGIGLFRSCYMWYSLVCYSMDQIAVSVGKWAGTVLKVTSRLNESIPKDPDSNSVYEDGQAMQIVANTIAQAQQFSGQPNGVLADSEVAELSVLATGGIQGLADLLELIRHANKEFSTLYLAAWLELGVENTGSRAVGEVHYAAYRAAVVNLLDLVKNRLTGRARPGAGTIDRFLKLNFYPNGREIPADEMPRVYHDGLKSDALADALGQLPALVAADIVPLKAVQRRVADLLDLDLEAAGISDDVAADITAQASTIRDLLGKVEGAMNEILPSNNPEPGKEG